MSELKLTEKQRAREAIASDEENVVEDNANAADQRSLMAMEVIALKMAVDKFEEQDAERQMKANQEIEHMI